MYQNTITLFNFHKATGLWYPSIIFGVDLTVNQADSVSVEGIKNADTAELLINCTSDKRIVTSKGAKSYIGAKEYQKCANPSAYITFTPEYDFFCEGVWSDTSPIDDEDYDSGLYHFINDERDGVYMINSAAFYSLIPHFEIGVSSMSKKSKIYHFPKVSYVDGNIKVKLDLSKYENRLEEAQRWLGERVVEGCKPLMPILTGSLQQRSTIEKGGAEVTFPGPYARYLYCGKVMENKVTGKGPRLIPMGPGSEDFIFRWPKGAKLIPTERKLNYSSDEATDHWFDEAKARYGERWIADVEKILKGEKEV